MTPKVCEICGYQSLLGSVEKQIVIPDEILQQIAEVKPREMIICLNCQRELETWYKAKINKIVYDLCRQAFRDQTLSEMIEEYESALKGFINNKREL